MTGTEPTSFTDPGTDTRRAANGGPFDPGAGDPFGWWGTFGVVATPQTIPSATVTMNGVTGNQRTVQYAVGIAPPGGLTNLPPQDKSGKIVTKTQMLEARSQAIKIGAKVKNKFDQRTRR